MLFEQTCVTLADEFFVVRASLNFSRLFKETWRKPSLLKKNRTKFWISCSLKTKFLNKKKFSGRSHVLGTREKFWKRILIREDSLKMCSLSQRESLCLFPTFSDHLCTSSYFPRKSSKSHLLSQNCKKTKVTR